MKKLVVLFILFVLAGTNVFSQDMWAVDDMLKATPGEIMSVILKAQKENHIKNINMVYVGQTVRYQYPDGGYFTHTYVRGEWQYTTVQNYLNIPNYKEIINPKRMPQVYYQRNFRKTNSLPIILPSTNKTIAITTNKNKNSSYPSYWEAPLKLILILSVIIVSVFAAIVSSFEKERRKN